MNRDRFTTNSRGNISHYHLGSITFCATTAILSFRFIPHTFHRHLIAKGLAWFLKFPFQRHMMFNSRLLVHYRSGLFFRKKFTWFGFGLLLFITCCAAVVVFSRRSLLFFFRVMSDQEAIINVKIMRWDVN